jgi:hypothetical protein
MVSQSQPLTIWTWSTCFVFYLPCCSFLVAKLLFRLHPRKTCSSPATRALEPNEAKPRPGSTANAKLEGTQRALSSILWDRGCFLWCMGRNFFVWRHPAFKQTWIRWSWSKHAHITDLKRHFAFNFSPLNFPNLRTGSSWSSFAVFSRFQSGIVGRAACK